MEGGECYCHFQERDMTYMHICSQLEERVSVECKLKEEAEMKSDKVYKNNALYNSIILNNV